MARPGSASKGFAPRFLAGGLLGYARSVVKNVIKAALSRKPHFTARDVVFRAWLSQLCGGPKLQKITCVSLATEGAGSQALMMMYAIDFARTAGLTYVHTPFADIHHADRPKQAWADAWEAHFNLGAGEIPYDRDSGGALNYAHTFLTLHALFGVERPEGDFDDSTLREFRRRYYLDKSPRQSEILSICVHARRYNRHDFHADDSTDLPRLARTLATLRSVLDARGVAYTLRLFSQGEPGAFCDLGIPEADVFLDADPLWSMREMIEADVLVTTLGSFSNVTGLLCDGIVLGDASEVLARGWIAYDANGDFEPEALASRLDML
jgi:hypothetical protein